MPDMGEETQHIYPTRELVMSETASENPTPEVPAVDAPGDTPAEVDYAAEAEKWKSLARKHEERAKANATAASELEQIRAAQMTEQEKAVAAARAEAKAAALQETAPLLVRLKFEAAAAGRLTGEQLDSLLEDVDMTRYLTETGEVDSERVARKIEALAPADAAPKFPDMGQGRRPAPAGKKQVSRDELDRMTPEEVVAAKKDGRLNDLMGIN